MSAEKRKNFDDRTHRELAAILGTIVDDALELETIGWINEILLRSEEKIEPEEWEQFRSAIEFTTKHVRQLSGDIAATLSEIL